jgi:hypothetical protein
VRTKTTNPIKPLNRRSSRWSRGLGVIVALAVCAIGVGGVSAAHGEPSPPVSLSADASGGVGSSRLERAVAHVYRQVLGRAPADEEMAFWVAHLALGGSRRDLTRLAAEASSAVSSVEDAYEEILGRPPDPEGSRFWVRQQQFGLGRLVMVLALLNSPEGVLRHPGHDDRVRVAYRLLLDREPDASGLRYWSSRLASGAADVDVFVALDRSVEASALRVANAYRLVFAREPDPAGFGFWTPQLLTTVDLVDLLASSDEVWGGDVALTGPFDVPGATLEARISGHRAALYVYSFPSLNADGFCTRVVAVLTAQGVALPDECTTPALSGAWHDLWLVVSFVGNGAFTVSLRGG